MPYLVPGTDDVIESVVQHCRKSVVQVATCENDGIAILRYVEPQRKASCDVFWRHGNIDGGKIDCNWGCRLFEQKACAAIRHGHDMKTCDGSLEHDVTRIETDIRQLDAFPP